MGLNRIQLNGNISNEPQLELTRKGNEQCILMIVTKDGAKDLDPQLHTVVVSGSAAKMVVDQLRKGDRIYVEGKLKTRDKREQDGETIIKPVILSSYIDLF